MVKLVEFSPPIDDSLPFNVVDDVAIFMRNDPMFYRKQLFPAIMKMKDFTENQKSIDAHKMFGPLVDKAAIVYCKKFNIPKRPEEIFTDEDKKNLVQKLYSEELNSIKKGVY